MTRWEGGKTESETHPFIVGNSSAKQKYLETNNAINKSSKI